MCREGRGWASGGHMGERWPQTRGLGVSGNYEAGKTSRLNLQTFPEEVFKASSSLVNSHRTLSLRLQ